MIKKLRHQIKSIPRRWVILAAALIAIGVLVASRPQKKEKGINLEVDPERTPTMMTTDASSLVSDSGYVRYKIEAPIWKVFDAAEEPNWKFGQGLYVEQYDDSMHVSGTFVCDSAIYRTTPKLWEFVGNVRVRNVAGDRFVTQLLFWNERERKIYSDSFIHIEKSDRVIEGYGFESDDRIEDYTVHHPTMIIPVSDFNRARNDTASTDATAPEQSPQPPARPVAGQEKRHPGSDPGIQTATANEPASAFPVRIRPSKKDRR